MCTQENGRYYDEDKYDTRDRKKNYRFLSSSQDRSRQSQQKAELVLFEYISLSNILSLFKRLLAYP